MAAEPDKKRAKLNDDLTENNVESTENKLKTLSGLDRKKIVTNDASSKRVVVLCCSSSKSENAESEKKAIVIMEKSPFNEADVGSILADEDTKLDKHVENDIYSWYDCFPPTKFNRIKMTVIDPATDQHIAKYSYKQPWILKETAKDYEDVTKPWIDSLQMKIQWVYNILDGKDEADRVVLKDDHAEEGFILLPDMKWDGKTVEEFYLLAIANRRGLGSLRDLRGGHVTMLKNIRDKSMATIKEKYGLSSGEMRVFFHYLPSYYHLHVHFMHVRTVTAGVNAERAHFLEDVIQNLELDSDYYLKKTFTISVPKNETLYNLYRDAGRL